MRGRRCPRYLNTASYPTCLPGIHDDDDGDGKGVKGVCRKFVFVLEQTKASNEKLYDCLESNNKVALYAVCSHYLYAHTVPDLVSFVVVVLGE